MKKELQELDEENEIRSEKTSADESENDREDLYFCNECQNLLESESDSEINVITSYETFMLELIDSISDPIRKRKKI